MDLSRRSVNPGGAGGRVKSATDSSYILALKRRRAPVTCDPMDDVKGAGPSPFHDMSSCFYHRIGAKSRQRKNSGTRAKP